MRVIIVHGTGGSENGNWFPWLKEKLKNDGIDAIVPQFPTPEGQSLESWKDTFLKYKGFIDEDTIFVGHSLGPAFILSLLEVIDTKVKACYLVAPFLALLGDEWYDSRNKTFVDKPFNWNKIRENCENFYIYYSDNDPYVPEEVSLEVAQKVNGEVYKIEGAGHLNAEFGYTEFERLYEDIMKFRR